MMPSRTLVQTYGTSTCTTTTNTAADEQYLNIPTMMPTARVDSKNYHQAARIPEELKQVKEELKQVIQNRRTCQGLGALPLPIKTENTTPQQLTPEEEMKILRRRQRNKRAASRCRDKRKQRLEELDREASELQRSNAQLERDIAYLRVEKDELSETLAMHRCVVMSSVQPSIPETELKSDP